MFYIIMAQNQLTWTCKIYNQQLIPNIYSKDKHAFDNTKKSFNDNVQSLNLLPRYVRILHLFVMLLLITL